MISPNSKPSFHTSTPVVHQIPIIVSYSRSLLPQTIHPLGVSIPLPTAVAFGCDQLSLRDSEGNSLVIQAKILQRWPNGSIRWFRIEWLHKNTAPCATDRLLLEILDRRTDFRNRDNPPALSVDIHSDRKFDPYNQEYLPSPFRLRLLDGSGNEWEGTPTNWKLLEDGPVFREFTCQLHFNSSTSPPCLLDFSCRLKHIPRLGTTINRLRVRNPQAATHPGGTWDLGNAGSFFIRDLSIEYDFPGSIAETQLWIQSNPNQELKQAEHDIHLFQASSGGINWQSSNHVDRSGKVPLRFCGYELRCDTATERGDRASPRVGIVSQQQQLVLCPHSYWENFPKSISVTRNRIRLGLFPDESGYLHELQGGEQKTHQWSVALQSTHQHDTLAWYQSSISTALKPESYASAQAVPYLTPSETDPNDDYLRLVDGAIEGTETFVSKREVIDQYGWRNFGDLYGDHEAVFNAESTPLISHYNNQYDCVGAFAIQFLRSGRREWWEQMIAMADHAWDIDTYHTDRDKNLYNGGLFWHTYHYADADTATHRSYPRQLSQQKQMPGGKQLAELGTTGQRLQKVYAIGGGPSASHNYSTGWMYAYLLTGEIDYREAAISAADYVQRIEYGKKTIFRWLSHADTGLSIESSPGYHGPGRASGNSLHALLTGFELTDHSSYLKSGEELIRRVIHPHDNIDRLDLKNAELRWFYTMFLQALMRYIDIKASLGMNDEGYAYAWSSLVHYARWMLKNESPTLDHPERLQYPTETWAAQDMRKWHILQYVAWLTPNLGDEQKLLQTRADFFFEYVCKTLKSMPSHHLCRPRVLMMQFGWQRAWFKDPRNQSFHPHPIQAAHFPPRIQFVPQRNIAIARAKALIISGGLTILVALLISLAAFLTQTAP